MHDLPDTCARHRRRWICAFVIPLVVIVGLPILLLLSLMPDWRQIQILRSADRQHVAKLDRLYGYIDVNFRVTLDGEVIHRSWDCAPDETLPFRETLAWDASGDILVFQLANQIVFAYDVQKRTEIDPAQFSSLVLPQVTLKDIGFEGQDELRERMQARNGGNPHSLVKPPPLAVRIYKALPFAA